MLPPIGRKQTIYIILLLINVLKKPVRYAVVLGTTLSLAFL